jgi:hypothetical protein
MRLWEFLPRHMLAQQELLVGSQKAMKMKKRITTMELLLRPEAEQAQGQQALADQTAATAELRGA